MEELIVPTNKAPSTPLERKVRPEKDQALNCPRCNSTNTKFCYYNNYSLTQPRYFCKTCRRYWTEGGSLRNIPVGGGSRKNHKRPSSSDTSPSSPSSKNPKIIHHNNHQPQDLNLGFPTTTHHEFRTLSEFMHFPIPTTTIETIPNNPKTTVQMSNSRGLLAPFIPDLYMQDFKPTLNFSLDGLGIIGNGFGSGTTFQQEEDQRNNNEDENGRLLFPLFEDLKQVSSNNASSNNTNNTVELQNHSNEQKQGEQQSTGYWSGMLGMGGAAW